MLHIYKNFILLLLLFSLINCGKSLNSDTSNSLVNTSHLDFLYEDIEVDGKEMGIIHIYSNYPEYEWIGDDDEGIACVDDASRAAVFYLRHHMYSGHEKSLVKAKNLLEFVLFMQSDNGFFYNFICEDHSINKEFRTSVAEPNWWSWRALWALMEGYSFYNHIDKEYAEKLLLAAADLVDEIKKNIPEKYLTKEIDGFTKPAWLPYETASDQAAILLLGLTQYYNETSDEIVLDYCTRLGEGIMLMQEGDSSSFPHGAFMSWENLWHGWGNLQSYSLLNFYEISENDSMKISALKEIDHFYNYLINRNYLNEFTIEKVDNKIVPAEEKIFPQIAYIIRPMVYSCIKAFEITGDSSYTEKAVTIAEWFFGKNRASRQMYFSENGKCYDGINNENDLNKNSGAESTIEALLALLEIENNIVAKEKFYEKTEYLLEDTTTK